MAIALREINEHEDSQTVTVPDEKRYGSGESGARNGAICACDAIDLVRDVGEGFDKVKAASPVKGS